MTPDMRSGPPPTEARPQQPTSTRTTGTASVTEAPDRLPALVAQAAALVEQIGDQAERDRQSWNAGYREAMAFCRAMFDHGFDVGYQASEDDMARAWKPIAQQVRRSANRLSFRALEERRYPDRTHRELMLLRGRDRYPLPDRECAHCHGTGMIPGGVA